MNKVIEALERIETTFSMNKAGKQSAYRRYTNSIYPYYEDFDLVLNALKRIEAIDNAKPSEALEDFKIIKFKTINAGYDYGYEVWNKIEQTLLKAQEQEKVLKIIFEKNVDIEDIKLYKNYEDYCKGKEKWLLRKDLWLTEEEFETLKRWKNER